MAITFPVAASVFIDTLCVSEVKFWLERYEEISGTGGGDVLVAEMAVPKWRATISLMPATHAHAAGIQALIDRIGSSGQFYVFNPLKKFPAADPKGTILGSAPVVIYAIGTNNHSLRLSGLPSGYVITRGDFMSYSFGSGPARQALVQAAETVTASASGITPAFDVSAPLRVGTVVGRPVTLKKPTARMIRYPGSFDVGTGSRGRFASGMTFQAIEA